MANIEIDNPDHVPWWRWGFVDGLVRLLMGVSMAITALPNQLWGLMVLLLGAWMLQYATNETRSLISAIIGAGTSLLASGVNKGHRKE